MMHAVHDGPAAAVRLGAVDLNLLPVLDALLHERHVTRAAKRVGLSQSAASHALARLRDLLGDPVRRRQGGRKAFTQAGDAGLQPRGGALGLGLSFLLQGRGQTRQGCSLFREGRGQGGPLSFTEAHQFDQGFLDQVAEKIRRFCA